jgi:Ankyrin repeats (3 copies)
MRLTSYKARLAVSLVALLLTACGSRPSDTKDANAVDSVTASSTSPSTPTNTPEPLRDIDRKLLAAAAAGEVKSVEELLRGGADVNARDETFGRTPLMEAAIAGQTKVTAKLIEKGADVKARDTFFGSTPLMFAAGAGSAGVVKVLLQKGAEVNAANNKGYTALDVAEEDPHEDVIGILKKAGAKRSGRSDTKSDVGSGDQMSVEELRRRLEELKAMEREARRMVALRNNWMQGAAECMRIMEELKPKTRAAAADYKRMLSPAGIEIASAAISLNVCVNCLENDDDTDCRSARESIRKAERELKKEARRK